MFAKGLIKDDGGSDLIQGDKPLKGVASKQS